MISLIVASAVVVVAVYVPVLIFAIRIMASSKDPLRRWRTLLACILYRLVATALFIAVVVPFTLPLVTQTYLVLCFALDVCSSWALTVCNAYLINIADEGKVTQHGSSSVSSHRDKKSTEALRLPGNVIVIAMIPSVWAILSAILARFGANVVLLYIIPLGPVAVALLFFAVVGYAVWTWSRSERMLHYRKRLLILVIVTLPLIAIRVVWGVLDVFSPITVGALGNFAPFLYPNSFGVFSMFEDTSPAYLIMDVLMECVVVIIYTVAGTMLPLDEDYRLTDDHPFLRLQHLGDTENQL